MFDRHWNWHGMVAIILAVAVGATLILAEVSIILRDGHATDTETSLISTAFGAAIGAIAVYLGGRDIEPPHAPPSTPAEPTPELEPWFEGPSPTNVEGDAERSEGG